MVVHLQRRDRRWVCDWYDSLIYQTLVGWTTCPTEAPILKHFLLSKFHLWIWHADASSCFHTVAHRTPAHGKITQPSFKKHSSLPAYAVHTHAEKRYYLSFARPAGSPTACQLLFVIKALSISFRANLVDPWRQQHFSLSLSRICVCVHPNKRRVEEIRR